MMTRVSSFLVLLVAALLLPWWATLLGVLFYTRWYTGLELIVGMVLVDAYVGVLWSGPYLTLGTIGIVVFYMIMRERLRTHNHTSL